MTLSCPNLLQLLWIIAPSSYPEGVISHTHSCRLIGKGYLAYLAHVRVVSQESPSLETTRIARELMDVFPTDLLGGQ